MLAKVLVGCVALFACAAPAAASASVLSGIESAPDGLPLSGTPGVAARSVKSIASVFDNQAGTWATTITFYGPQSAATEAKLYLDFDESPLVHNEPEVGIQAWTDPGNARTTTVGTFTATPAPAATTTFSTDLRSMTIVVSGLAGLPLNDLDTIRLSKGAIYDGFPSLTLAAAGAQGPAPTVDLPSSDRSLRVRHGAIALKLGNLTHPSSSAAFVELNGKLIARSIGINLGSALPASVSLPVIAGVRLPRAGRHTAKLIFITYSPTGMSTTVTKQVTLTT
jgi:hypothetical protein